MRAIGDLSSFFADSLSPANEYVSDWLTKTSCVEGSFSQYTTTTKWLGF